MAESRVRRPRVSRRTSPTVLERINPDAAGIDCGSTMHVVAVPPDRDESVAHSAIGLQRQRRRRYTSTRTGLRHDERGRYLRECVAVESPAPT